MDELISKLSEIRSEYNCFDENEEPYYRALSEAIKILSQLADGDLISRQAAIDALKGLEFCHYMEFGEYIGEDTREVRLIRAEKARDALLKLPSAQPEQRWIPCSERLPKQYGNYLISIDGKDSDIGTINPNDPRGWSLCDANGFYWANDKALNITAWQTLPEPYRGRR